ncbi:MAG: cold shock domain-containing protein [Fulvivirga sp.]|nr:cold shock domain-containing protein [Fulvivirga sp.]
MATFNKKEREKKKLRKRKEKEQRREERKAAETSGKLDDMMAYVDEYGNILDSPPEEQEKEEVNAEDIVVGVPKSEPVDLDQERRGKVAFFNENKGYGFIDQSQSGDRYFVHANNLKQPIYEGDKVKFTLEKGPKGLIAVGVEKM